MAFRFTWTGKFWFSGASTVVLTPCWWPWFYRHDLVASCRVVLNFLRCTHFSCKKHNIKHGLKHAHVWCFSLKRTPVISLSVRVIEEGSFLLSPRVSPLKLQVSCFLFSFAWFTSSSHFYISLCGLWPLFHFLVVKATRLSLLSKVMLLWSTPMLFLFIVFG